MNNIYPGVHPQRLHLGKQLGVMVRLVGEERVVVLPKADLLEGRRFLGGRLLGRRRRQRGGRRRGGPQCRLRRVAPAAALAARPRPRGQQADALALGQAEVIHDGHAAVGAFSGTRGRTS